MKWFVFNISYYSDNVFHLSVGLWQKTSGKKKSSMEKKTAFLLFCTHLFLFSDLHHNAWFFFGFMRLMLSCVFLIALTTGMFQFRKDASSVCKEAPWFVYVDAWWMPSFFWVSQFFYMIAYAHQNCQIQLGFSLHHVCFYHTSLVAQILCELCYGWFHFSDLMLFQEKLVVNSYENPVS